MKISANFRTNIAEKFQANPDYVSTQFPVESKKISPSTKKYPHTNKKFLILQLKIYVNNNRKRLEFWRLLFF